MLALFRQLHGELRAEVVGSDDEALNWAPCEGANSPATIITHTLGSEAETILSVAGEAAERDRSAEFELGDQTGAELIARLDGADALLDRIGHSLGDGRLAARQSLPTLPSTELRSGLTWLVGNLGHAREHMGHLRLTLQLYREQEPHPAAR